MIILKAKGILPYYVIMVRIKLWISFSFFQVQYSSEPECLSESGLNFIIFNKNYFLLEMMNH